MIAFVVVVLHEFPVESALFGPCEVVFDGVPVDAGVLEDRLLGEVAVLGFPCDFGARRGVEVDVDESVAVYVGVDGEEADF